MSIPEASAVEAVAEVPVESPAEVFLAHLAALEEKFSSMKKDMFKQIDEELTALRKAAKKAIKVPRKSRKGTHPKGETPAQVGAWNAFIAETLATMKESGWPSYTYKDTEYPGGVEEDGKWIVDAEDAAKRVPPSYKVAMTYAAYRKANGEYAGDPEAEERKAAAAAAKAEAAAARAEAKAAKAAAKAAGMATKSTSGAAAGGAGKPAKPAKAAADEKAAPAKADGSKAAKPSAKPAKAKPAAAAAAASPAEDTIAPWTFKGKKYLRTGANECWLMNADGSQGKWAGVYDSVKNIIDASAEEPACDFE